MKFQAPRGTRDLFGQPAQKLNTLVTIARNFFALYNYQEIILPIFEDARLFIRSIGETTDIVEKEMYTFTDRKGRQLALRPEGTAGVIRAYLENNLAQHSVRQKFFYCGAMFRYERPQAGRYRQFYQIGAEYIGNPTPVADAEIILLASDILQAIGIKGPVIELNSLGCSQCRPNYRQALINYLTGIKNSLCDDCQQRLEKNPLRILDCKIDSPKLKNIPRPYDYLCEQCREKFTQLQQILKESQSSFTINHRLVRGLDYYTGAVFEIIAASTGSSDALAAGGRYDNLVEELGGRPTPAVGFALGAERVLSALSDDKKISTGSGSLFYIAYTGSKFSQSAFNLATNIRHSGYPAEIGQPDKNLSDQLRLANKLKATIAVIIADEEYSRGQLIWRDLNSGHQEIISSTALLEKIKSVTKITKI